MTTKLTDETFDRSLRAARHLLVVFQAGWCLPCNKLGPELAALAREFDGRLVLAGIDVDDNPRTTARFRIQSVPTLLFFRGDELVDRIVGRPPITELHARVTAWLADEGAGDLETA